MTQAGYQGKRYGVRDVGADDTRRSQARIEEEERRHAQRPGSDRGHGDQRAEDRADDKGSPRSQPPIDTYGGTPRCPRMKFFSEHEGAGREEQRNPEPDAHDRREFLGMRNKQVQQHQGRSRGGHAACREPSDNAPVNVAPPRVSPRPACFGQGGKQQVCADRGDRGDSKRQYEQRRHQRAAAHAGDADDQADRKSRNRREPIHRGSRRGKNPSPPR